MEHNEQQHTQRRKKSYDFDPKDFKCEKAGKAQFLLDKGYTEKQLAECAFLDTVMICRQKLAMIQLLKVLRPSKEMELVEHVMEDHIACYLQMVQAGCINHDETMATLKRLDKEIDEHKAQEAARGVIAKAQGHNVQPQANA